MPTLTFSYTALNNKGKQVNGTVPADNRAAAIAAVSGRGLSPLSVVEARGSAAGASNMVHKSSSAATPKPTAAKAGAQGAHGGGAAMKTPLFGRGRVSQKDVENFTREMASLLAGGVPLARALSLLMREAKLPA